MSHVWINDLCSPSDERSPWIQKKRRKLRETDQWERRSCNPASAQMIGGGRFHNKMLSSITHVWPREIHPQRHHAFVWDFLRFNHCNSIMVFHTRELSSGCRVESKNGLLLIFYTQKKPKQRLWGLSYKPIDNYLIVKTVLQKSLHGWKYY